MTKIIEWLIAIGLLTMAVLLCFTVVGHAETVVCYKPQCSWNWNHYTGTGDYYVVESSTGVQYTTPVKSVVAAPPDREAIESYQLRFKVCFNTGGCSDWGPWSYPVYGVPAGWDPDVDRDGQLLAPDYDLWFRAFVEDFRWLRP